MLKRAFFLFSFSLLAINLAFSQIVKKEAQSSTIGIADQSLIDQLMMVVPGIGSSTKDLLNGQNIKPYMMPVRKIGFRGTELSYALATCLEYYVNLNKNYKVNLSPDYIALSVQNTGQKVDSKSGFAHLVKDGTVSAAIMPYDANAITSAVFATQKFKIQNYLHLYREISREKQRIYETKKALMRGNPVLVELKVQEKIKDHKGSLVLASNLKGDQSVFLVAVGYDEAKEHFELLSPWGSEWGKDGYAKVKYADFGKYVVNGYVMIPQQQY